MSHLLRIAGAIGLVVTRSAFTTERINYQNVHINANDNGPLQKIPARPTRLEGGGPHPAVVLLHTCGGLNTNVTDFWPGVLARLGHITLAPDSLTPRNLRRGIDTPPQMGSDRERIRLERDAHGALE